MDLPPKFKSGNAAFQKALNDVVSYAQKHGINPGGMQGWQSSPDGWVPPLPGSDGGSLPVGFKVRLNAAKTAVTISPSVITGLTGVSAFPTIGGTRLDAETVPTLNVSSGDEIYATVELDPVATLRAGTGIGSGDSAVPAVYEIGSSYSAISTTFEIAIVSESLERLPVIDAASGTVETSGLYLIPIAKIIPAGESIRVQQYCYGPIAVNYCTGNLTIIPPTIITSGNFVTINA